MSMVQQRGQRALSPLLYVIEIACRQLQLKPAMHAPSDKNIAGHAPHMKAFAASRTAGIADQEGDNNSCTNQQHSGGDDEQFRQLHQVEQKNSPECKHTRIPTITLCSVLILFKPGSAVTCLVAFGHGQLQTDGNSFAGQYIFMNATSFKSTAKSDFTPENLLHGT